uniref:Protein kinase domain-containing protein n=1 Tax=Chromera velia CCMP2878 TaxID=1169474 RepID=A0A0G4G5E3_9ALVE|eukprot:Cvel_20339.t1-p1 / transcript=Cvel_20339.t1 / gene=Cvel_20339 / organism=Chromera_velia_CCMP2878 / gene_product=hypothetical protein / transcript_product=hypothetical protein / location=Cvel_scaffold1817:20626-27014(+) / protein_length=371 / sequence_SO=supercontig / SO=protein_coding / is_pseudo=false
MFLSNRRGLSARLDDLGSAVPEGERISRTLRCFSYTPGYLSPELLATRGERKSKAGDIWALGVVGLELLSGVFVIDDSEDWEEQTRSFQLKKEHAELKVSNEALKKLLIRMVSVAESPPSPVTQRSLIFDIWQSHEGRKETDDDCRPVFGLWGDADDEEVQELPRCLRSGTLAPSAVTTGPSITPPLNAATAEQTLSAPDCAVVSPSTHSETADKPVSAPDCTLVSPSTDSETADKPVSGSSDCPAVSASPDTETADKPVSGSSDCAVVSPSADSETGDKPARTKEAVPTVRRKALGKKKGKNKHQAESERGGKPQGESGEDGAGDGRFRTTVRTEQVETTVEVRRGQATRGLPGKGRTREKRLRVRVEGV